MRRVIFEEKGGPEVLKFEALDLPSPATGEVGIKIKAIGMVVKGTAVTRSPTEKPLTSPTA